MEESRLFIGNESTNHVSTLMFVFINVPTIRLSLSAELQSRIRENNHAMLNQLGPTVHHSSRFDYITISYSTIASYERHRLQVALIVGKIGQNIKTTM